MVAGLGMQVQHGALATVPDGAVLFGAVLTCVAVAALCVKKQRALHNEGRSLFLFLPLPYLRVP